MTNTPHRQANILVWDAPVRVTHWLCVLCFVGAYVTADTERWRLLHITLGYTLGALMAFRILWGLVGSRHARFASFVRGPAALQRYLGSLLAGRPEHHTGHNPAGAVAIVLLLVLGLALALTGWALDSDWGGKLSERLHDAASNLMLAVVLIHLVGVLVASWLHHENLVQAMVTGRKTGLSGEGIARPWWVLAVLIVVVVLGYWGWQWQSLP